MYVHYLYIFILSRVIVFFIVMIEWRDIKLNQFIKININDDVNNCEEEGDDIQYNTYTKYTCI